MIQLIFAVLVVLLISGLASGTEAALFAVSYSKVLTAVEQKKKGANSLKRLKENMRIPIMTIVVINNIANIVGSIAVGAIAASVLGSSWLGLFSALLTFLIIVFSEIIPKTVGEEHDERISLFVAKPLLFLSKLLRPITFFVDVMTKPFIKTTASMTTSEDEIRVLARIGRQEGAIEHGESRMIQHVFRLNDITTFDMMTIRADVDALESSRTVGELREKIMTLTHSRIPVVDGSLDNVVGVAHIRFLLEALAKDEDHKTIGELASEVDFVPETMVGDDLIKHFQKEKDHLAVVVDTRGTVIGIVTLEDVLEELVGEITDETDVEPEMIRRISKTEILAHAETDLHHINDFFNSELPDDGRIGELLLKEFGYIPKVGEEVLLGGCLCRVEEASAHKIESIRITKPIS